MTDLLNKNKDKVTETVKKIVGFMNLDCQLEIREENHRPLRVNSDSRSFAEDGRSVEGGSNSESKALVVSVYTSDDARFIIGKNGQNLKALEHLVRAILSKKSDIQNIVLDINDYKKSRASFVVDVAKQAVTRVRNTQKAEVLTPMSAYERRIVHMELASYPDVATESIGDEPQRRIVIKPYP